MNERMVELYKEAAEFAYEMCKSEGRAGGASDHIWNTLSTGKFAELIVRECIQAIQNESMNSGDEWEDGLRIAEGAIREHFGVEE